MDKLDRSKLLIYSFLLLAVLGPTSLLFKPKVLSNLGLHLFSNNQLKLESLTIPTEEIEVKHVSHDPLSEGRKMPFRDVKIFPMGKVEFEIYVSDEKIFTGIGTWSEESSSALLLDINVENLGDSIFILNCSIDIHNTIFHCLVTKNMLNNEQHIEGCQFFK